MADSRRMQPLAGHTTLLHAEALPPVYTATVADEKQASIDQAAAPPFAADTPAAEARALSPHDRRPAQARRPKLLYLYSLAMLTTVMLLWLTAMWLVSSGPHSGGSPGAAAARRRDLPEKLPYRLNKDSGCCWLGMLPAERCMWPITTRNKCLW
ncbi:hypothetical protein LTR53_001282 [Teratosphaeriaceae sp. CCFEE 6253]|nr:hypothetical protein LTR53_001282 [Teratosphaeriaceae sp. CCFEE 6253]